MDVISNLELQKGAGWKKKPTNKKIIKKTGKWDKQRKSKNIISKIKLKSFFKLTMMQNKQ